MEQIFNKLVRDKIPDKIEKNGEIAITRVLQGDEFQKELYKKLQEETKEVITSMDNEQRMEELADVLEVIISIANLQKKELIDILKIADQKRTKRGGFSQRIFLERTIKKD